jgi:hypothetical protein
MILCIVFTFVRKLKPVSRISALVACTRTRRFEKSLVCREHRLVVGSAAIASSHSQVHRPGFRVLRCTNGGSNYRASRACGFDARGWASRARVSGRAVEGSARISVSNHLWFSKTGIPSCDDRAFQGPADEEKAHQSSQRNAMSRHYSVFESGSSPG